MKLKPREIHRHKPGRPFEQGNLAKISRKARVIETSDVLFEVKFGKNERYKFRKESASVYVKPCHGAEVRCMYKGNKYQTFPYKVYTRFNEILFEERQSIENKVK
jgi:hypothetical protein